MATTTTTGTTSTDDSNNDEGCVFDVLLPLGTPIGVVNIAKTADGDDDSSSCFCLRLATVSFLGPHTLDSTPILKVGDIIQAIDDTPLLENDIAELQAWKTELNNTCNNKNIKFRTLTIWRQPSPSSSSANNNDNEESKKKRPLESTAAQGQATKKGAATKKQKSSNTKEENEQQQQPPLPLLNLNEMPWPGFISQNQQYYSTLNNETTTKIASKLGCSWKDLAAVEENQQRYGTLKSTSILKPSTYLRIPTEKASKFKLSKLMDQDEMFKNSISVCMECGGRENPQDPDDPEMLLCDGCDVACHVKCSDQVCVPQGEWFCGTCLDILQARRARYGRHGGVSLVVNGPPKAAPLQLSKELSALVTKAKTRLGPHLRAQREATTSVLEAQQAERLQSGKKQLKALKQAKERAEATHEAKGKACTNIKRDLCNLYDVVKYGGFSAHCVYGYSYIILRVNNAELKLTCRHDRDTPRWNFAVSQVRQVEEHQRLERGLREIEIARKKVDEARSALWKLENELKGIPCRNRRVLQERAQAYAGMLQEPRLAFETTKAMFNSRESPPRLLGFVKVSSDADAASLVTLKEPIPLIVAIPLVDDDDDNYKYTEEILVDHDYAIFARAQLFCPTHDDNLPMESHGGARSAQRCLMEMIDSDPRNSVTAISRPQVPSSVRVRGGGPDEEGKDFSKCFDLSELVRDCTCDVDLPRASTPQRLAEHGLVLRDYQKSSLQFMLDKEKGTSSGLGFAGELWSRNLTFDGEQYYFCPLTGSFSRDIFDYKQEAQGKNSRNPAPVAKHCGGLPRGGVLADEMGLGKSIISIALIAANPPSKENRVLAREYKFEKKPTHPAYSIPPSVAGACCVSSQKVYLSNGTLIVAPMTLCSQWQSEIKKFAPWYTTLTIHNSEKPTVQELASVDIIIASTVAVSNRKKDNQSLTSKLKRIHFHRILVDESHFQQQGQKTCLGLSKLSATYRWGVTGTPIGSTLDDLHGQCGFLRIPGFTRELFWKNAISDPYIEHNTEALRVLRCLLSHVVIRHSKEQTVAGNAIVELPPRTVTTEIIPFGSEHERNVYNTLEARNRLRFQGLQRESVEKVLNEFVDLTGMMLGARQACSHSSAVDLYQLERLNNRILCKNERAAKKPSPKLDAKYDGATANTRATILARALHWAPDSAKNRVRRVMMSFQEGEVELMECPICLEPFSETEAAITECGHPFCRECILNLFDACGSRTRDGRGRCASCRTDIGRDRVTFLGDAEDAGHAQARPHQAHAAAPAVKLSANVNGFSLTASDLHVPAGHDSETPRSVWQPLTAKERLDQRAFLSSLSQPFLETFEKAAGSIGTKVSKLIEEVKEMMKRDHTNKAVVFSQFIDTLDCASHEMAARGIRFVRIDDSMQQHERADALLDFSSDPNCKVFLLSSRAGAQGLTLTAANSCFILDAPLNSALEEQSIDRIHRIGQTRSVFVKRLVMENTVEERILQARRSIAADRPQAGCANIDGTSLVANEQRCTQKRERHRDEEDIEERRFEKLATLEMLFGCSSDCHVTKA